VPVPSSVPSLGGLPGRPCPPSHSGPLPAIRGPCSNGKGGLKGVGERRRPRRLVPAIRGYMSGCRRGRTRRQVPTAGRQGLSQPWQSGFELTERWPACRPQGEIEPPTCALPRRRPRSTGFGRFAGFVNPNLLRLRILRNTRQSTLG